jgi:DNA-binding SARP family transcriptional activator/TolB-like protein
MVGFLWPDCTTAGARKLLSEALYVVRKELSETAILASNDELRLNAAIVGSDLADFRAALDVGQLQQAVGLYTGPFLDGWYIDEAPDFERWVEEERADLARRFAESLQKLAEREEESGDWLGACGWWRRLSSLDRYSSRIALRHALSQARAGERGAALQTLVAHETIMSEELGVSPDAEVAALASQLRGAEGAVSVPPRISPREIQTISTIPDGMPFDVRHTRPTASDIPVDSRESQARRSKGSPTRIWRGVLAASLTTASMGWAALALISQRGGHDTVDAAKQAAPLDPNQVAIRRFDDLTRRNPELTDALSDQLIAMLSDVAPLRVVARSAMTSMDSTVSLDSLGRALHVGTVIDGTISQSGDFIRIRATINDVASGSAVAQTTYEGPREDLFQLIDHASLRIDSLVRLHLGRQARLGELHRGTSSPVAIRYLAAGQRALDAGVVRANEFAVGRAAALLREADSLFQLSDFADPRWSQPPIKRALAAKVLASIQGDGAFRTLTAGIHQGEEALRRDTSSAAAREILGILHWRRARLFVAGADRAADSIAAVTALRDATTRDSLRVGAWAMRARMAWSSADAESARELAAIAAKRDPYYDGQSDILESLFLAQLWIRDWDGARRSCARGRQQEPANYRFIQCSLTLLRYTAASRGDATSAWALVTELDGLPVRDSAATAGRAYVPLYWRAAAAAISARVGDKQRARRELAELEQEVARAGEMDSFAPDRAILYWLTDRPDSAQTILAAYLAKRPEERAKAVLDALLGPISNYLPPSVIRKSGADTVPDTPRRSLRDPQESRAQSRYP